MEYRLVRTLATLILPGFCVGTWPGKNGTLWGQESQSELPAPREVMPLEQAGIQPLEKGPIHEAFAEPGAPTRGEGLRAPKAPPPPIPEEPPESKPEGENVQWIPGYWYWDQERQDYIWISGFWRNVPPNRVWEPGKWYAEGGEWVYRPGFWRPASMNSWRVDLPSPPTPVENGPSTPPPSDGAVWIPGHWEYREGRYVWQAGYWAYPNGVMMWHPPQYLYTGSGYLYVPGYWDYPLEWRGVLYTPVCFTQPVWLTPGWRWRPRLALGLGLGWGWGFGGLFSSLYIGPGWNYFFYGNWWDPWWYTPWWYFPSIYWPPIWNIGVGVGWWYSGWWGWPGRYCPWWCYRPGCWNPLWQHYCWLNRNNPNWRGRVQTAALIASTGNSARTVGVRSGLVQTGGNLVTPRNGIIAGAATVAATAARATARQVVQREQSRLIQPAEQVVRTLQQANAARRVQLSSSSPTVSAGLAGRGGNNTVIPNQPSTAGGSPRVGVSNSVPAVRPTPGTGPSGTDPNNRTGTASPSNPPAAVRPASNPPWIGSSPPATRPNPASAPANTNPSASAQPPLRSPPSLSSGNVSPSPGNVSPLPNTRPPTVVTPGPSASVPPTTASASSPVTPASGTSRPTAPSTPGGVRPAVPNPLPVDRPPLPGGASPPTVRPPSSGGGSPPAVRPSLLPSGATPPAVRPSLPSSPLPSVRPGSLGGPGIVGPGVPRGLPGVRPSGGAPRR